MATNVRVRKYMSREEYENGGARLICKRGNDLPHAKLNESLVREIRATAGEITSLEWARRLGMHRRSIDAVRNYINWVHVK